MLRLLLSTNDQVEELEVVPTSSVGELRISLVDRHSQPVHLLTDYKGEDLELQDDWAWTSFASADEPLSVEVLVGDIVRIRSAMEEVLIGMETFDIDSIKTAEMISVVKTGDLPMLIEILNDHEAEFNEELVGEEEVFINSFDERGWTALHHACTLNQDLIVQLLLSKGASCNIESNDGWTPLQLCAASDHWECLKLLLESGKSQLNKMTIQPPALHIACEGNNLNSASLLLQAGASMALEDQHGRIPLEACHSQQALEMLPFFMGQHEVDKALHPEKYEQPKSYCGEVYFTSSVVLDDRKVCLFLDIANGLLNHYTTKPKWRTNSSEPEFSVPIVEIYDIRSIKSKQIGRSSLWFFILDCKQRSFCYYCRDKQRSSDWASRIFSAIEYCQANKIGPLPTFKRLEVAEGESPTSLEFSSTSGSPHGSFSGEFEVNFSSFNILDELGAGTFGTVFKVMRKDTSAIFAMKQLNKGRLKKKKQFKYAIAESKIMRHLDHPFIVTLYNAFETPKNLYLVMEYCPNGDLETFVQKRGRLQEQAACFYIAEIILAIEYLHSLNIIYRDLKPANVLLDKDGHAQLADFGLAKENANNMNPATTFVGSPAYIAPELLRNRCTTKASDIYGLGVMLFELLTSEPPFFCEDIQELFRKISESKVNYPRYVRSKARNLINKLMNKDHTKRPKFSQIKAHPFFVDIDWNLMLQRSQSPPPITRQVEDEFDSDMSDEFEMEQDENLIMLDQDYPADTPRDQLVEGFSFTKD